MSTSTCNAQTGSQTSSSTPSPLSSPPPSFTFDLVIPDVMSLLSTEVKAPPMLNKMLTWNFSAKIGPGLTDEKKYVYFALTCNKTVHSPWGTWLCNASFKLTIKRQGRGSDLVRDYKHPFTNYRGIPSEITKCFSLKKLLDETKGYTKDGRLHVKVKVTPEPTPSGFHFKQKTKIQSKYPHDPSSVASVTFQQLLDSGEGGNVTIVTKDGGEVKAHRGVLEAKSPVFERMFQADMEEARSGIIRMEDMTLKSVKAFLSFLYLGDFTSVETMARVEEVIQLINAAEKYEFPALKEYCGYVLVERLTFENAIKVYKVSARFNMINAEKEIFRLIMSNLTETMRETKCFCGALEEEEEEKSGAMEGNEISNEYSEL